MSRPTSAPTPSTTWTFGTIPEKTTNGHAGWALEHFPALQDEGTGVTLRLFASASAAAAAHANGVARLFLLALGPHARIPFRRNKLPLGAAIYLRDLNYEDDRIADDILAGAVREAFVRDQPPVRDQAMFEQRLRERRTALNLAQDEIARIVSESVTTAAHLGEAALLPLHALPPETAESIQTQLAWLLFRGFPRVVPLAQLRHYARYLKGAAIRLERARTNPAGDREKEARLALYVESDLAGNSLERNRHGGGACTQAGILHRPAAVQVKGLEITRKHGGSSKYGGSQCKDSRK